MKAYEEIVEFIAAGTNPSSIISFQPSEEVKERISNLIFREKNEELAEDEREELDHYLQLEHIMRLAKARARKYLINE